MDFEMNRTSKARPNCGFTLIELLLVIAIIAILAALLLPKLGQVKRTAQLSYCANNLQQIGVAFHSFAHDHNSKFPMQVFPAEGGTCCFQQTFDGTNTWYAPTYLHLQALSNDLVNPKLVWCPTDTRVAAEMFGALQNDNVSYFVVPNTVYGESTAVLAGDRNLTNDTSGDAKLLIADQPLRWTEELHRGRGNLLLADGHVEKHGRASITLASIRSQPPDLRLPQPGELTPVAGPTPILPPLLSAANGGSYSSGQFGGLGGPQRFRWDLAVIAIDIPLVPVALTNPAATEVFASGAASAKPVEVAEGSGINPFPSEPTTRNGSNWIWLILLLLVLLAAYVIWRQWIKWFELRDRRRAAKRAIWALD